MAHKDILFFGGQDWHCAKKLSSHHVVQRLARNNRVFYVDNFGGARDLVIADLPRAVSKLRAALRTRFRNTAGVAALAGQPVVLQPLVVPTPRLHRIFGPLNGWLLARQVSRLIPRYDIREAVIWTEVPTEVVWRCIQHLPHRLLVYQAVDRFPYSPMIPAGLRPYLASVEALFRDSADLVFASAYGIFSEKKSFNPNTYFFPNGVDVEMFGAHRGTIQALDGLPRPIVGFAGSIGPWVDLDLIRAAAQATPHWSYVLVGPANYNVDTSHLAALKNVHLAGLVPFEQLPLWYRGFDVGVIPYVVNDFTRYTFPSKLAEYLASGIPVVSTALPEVVPYAKVVHIVQSAEDMISAIGYELSQPDQEGRRRARQSVARTLSWDTLVAQMETLIDDAWERAR